MNIPAHLQINPVQLKQRACKNVQRACSLSSQDVRLVYSRIDHNDLSNKDCNRLFFLANKYICYNVTY